MANGTEVGWVSEPSGRGTASLLWSSLSTLLICLFASLHLNVPAKDDSQLARVLRKLKWTLFAAIAPEVVLYWAFEQWCITRRETQWLRSHGVASWTQTHSFYLNMGGVCIRNADNCPDTRVPCQELQLIDCGAVQQLLSEGRMPAELRNLDKGTITDSSKGDWFVKIFACLQAGWFLLQCIGRAAQGLPLSTLEVSTSAFVLMAMGNYFFWWNKPLDVSTRTFITMSCVKVGGSHERLPTVSGIRLISSEAAFGRIRNGISSDDTVDAIYLFIFTFVFASVHCAAWNFAFPTNVEQMLWRVACLVSGFLPVVIVFVALLPHVAVEKYLGDGCVTLENYFDKQLIQAILLVIYILARLYLLTEVFTSLRLQPPECYDTVDWAKFLPYIG